MGASVGAADLVVVRDGTAERHVPIQGWLIVGRQCFGVDDAHRLVIERAQISRNHLEISRNHLEIRLEPERDRAFVIDLSTNGTRLNGARLGRAVPAMIKPGDRLELGGVELEFRSERFRGGIDAGEDRTGVAISQTDMVVVAGDVIDYSTVSETTKSGELAAGMGHLFHELSLLLESHNGQLANHAGDAILGVWEQAAIPAAADEAIRFALAAVDRVKELTPELSFAAPDGRPLRMGWAVVSGKVAVGSLAGALLTVIGDATNLAFRLAGLAGRDGRPHVLVTADARGATSERFDFGDVVRVTVKGRVGLETVHGVESGLSVSPGKRPAARRRHRNEQVP